VKRYADVICTASFSPRSTDTEEQVRTSMRSIWKEALHAEAIQLVANDYTHHDSLPSPLKDVTFVLSCLQCSSGERLSTAPKAADNRSNTRSPHKAPVQTLTDSSCSTAMSEELARAGCEKLTHLNCQNMKASDKGRGETPIRDR